MERMQIFLLLNSVIGSIVLYMFLRGICKVVSGFSKWVSLSNAKNINQINFKKAKWDALENKELLRMGAHVGWEGVGVDFEHDNRESSRIDPLKMRLKRLEGFFQEGLITDKEYSQRKQEIIGRI